MRGAGKLGVVGVVAGPAGGKWGSKAIAYCRTAAVCVRRGEVVIADAVVDGAPAYASTRTIGSIAGYGAISEESKSSAASGRDCIVRGDRAIVQKGVIGTATGSAAISRDEAIKCRAIIEAATNAGRVGENQAVRQGATKARSTA